MRDGAENSGGINVGGMGSWGGRGGCVCVVGAAVFFRGGSRAWGEAIRREQSD